MLGRASVSSGHMVHMSDDSLPLPASPQDNQIRIFADSRELAKSMVCLLNISVCVLLCNMTRQCCVLSFVEVDVFTNIPLVAVCVDTALSSTVHTMTQCAAVVCFVNTACQLRVS